MLDGILDSICGMAFAGMVVEQADLICLGTQKECLPLPNPRACNNFGGTTHAVALVSCIEVSLMKFVELAVGSGIIKLTD